MLTTFRTTDLAPRRRAGLSTTPDADGHRTIVTDEPGSVNVRLGPAAAELFARLDGRHSPARIASELGAPEDAIHDALRELDRLNLLERSPGEMPAPAPRRLRYRPPGVVELTLVHGQRVTDALARLMARLDQPALRLVRRLATAAAVVVVGVSRHAIAADAGRAPSPTVLLVAAILALASNVIHELAHGAALARRGGRVRRFGVRSHYGAPTLFCDVTDAWRLSRRDRVAVALAGIRANLGLATIAAGGIALAPAGPARQVAVAVLVINTLYAVFNLCPFVKFDGYIALAGWLDEPHLRRHCMDEARAALLHLIGASVSATRTSALRTAFGAAAIVTGPALVLYAYITYQPSLLVGLGGAGALFVLAVEAAGGVWLFRAVWRTVSGATWRRSSARRVLVGVALSAVALVAIAMTPVTRTTSAVWTVSPTKGAAVLSSTGPVPGTTVELHAAGLVLHPVVSRPTVCGPVVHHRIALCGDIPDHGSGMAVLSHHRTNVGGWLASALWSSPASHL